MNKTNTKKLKELIDALEKVDLPKEIEDKIINIFILSMESKTKKTTSLSNQTNLSSEEILYRSFARLDREIERTEDLKTRVDLINYELEKLAY